MAFLVMRTLATIHLFWSSGGALPLDALPGLVPASAESLAGAIDRLRDEGVVELLDGGRTIRLTDRGALDLCYLTDGSGLRSTATA